MDQEKYACKFIHLRLRDNEGNPQPFGGVCIAYDVARGDSAKDGDVLFAFARCSKRDIYNKKIARKIASGRLEKWLLTGSSKLHIVHLNGRKPKDAIIQALRAVGQQSVMPAPQVLEYVEEPHVVAG